GTSQRSEHNILGNRTRPSVVHGNLMVSRMTLILYAARFLGIHWLLENPSQSLLFDHPRLKTFLQHAENWECRTHLGMYGAPTWKPVKLVSSDPVVEKLYRTLDRSLFEPSNSTVKYQTADGRPKFQGSRHLKATQVYPPRFGRRVFQLFTKEAHHLTPVETIDYTPDAWEDAKPLDCQGITCMYAAIFQKYNGTLEFQTVFFTLHGLFYGMPQMLGMSGSHARFGMFGLVRCIYCTVWTHLGDVWVLDV
ncbi:unnamed protein product, partial [Cladocopium goreaui]